MPTMSDDFEQEFEDSKEPVIIDVTELFAA